MDDLATTLRGWATTLPRAQFLMRASGFYLVIEVLPGEDDKPAFDTRSSSHERLMKAAAAAQARRIIALKKNERSPYSTQIAVGRTRNCDVVLRSPSVSKLHAQFLVKAEGWQVVDRGSANGTEVNGRRLSPHQPARVVAGDRIQFGDADCLFADGAVLFRELGPG